MMDARMQAEMRQIVRDEVRRALGSAQADLRTVVERVQTMNGDRGAGDGSQRAVRRGDIGGVGVVTLTSAQVAAAPTQAEFNALQADVAALAAWIAKLRDTFVQA